MLRNQSQLASSVSIFWLCAQLCSHCWETVGKQVANRCSQLKEIWEKGLFAFSEHLYLLAHDSSREEGILEFGISPRLVPPDACGMIVPMNPISPCLTTFPAPALMDESITSPGRLLVWIWVNTNHPQLLYHNAALKRRSCWKDVTFQQSKTRWKRFQRGNLLVPVAMWSCCLILMVPGIFSQGKAVCDLYFSMAGWLGRGRSPGKPYSEGEQEVKDHLLPQRRAAVTPRGEGLKCKGSPKSCPDSCRL